MPAFDCQRIPWDYELALVRLEMFVYLVNHLTERSDANVIRYIYPMLHFNTSSQKIKLLNLQIA